MASTASNKCCGTREDAGRSALAGTVLFVGAGALALALTQMFTRVVLDSAERDVPGMLLWGDVVAASVVVCVSVLLFLPDCCRVEDAAQARATRRSERNIIAFLLLVVTIITTITSRVRHLNMSTSHDESTVCGRKDAADACPSQRITLSEPYNLWRRNNENATVCWFNTTAPTPDAFLWGQEYKDAPTFPTADFSLVDTYEKYPQYAPCYYYGCSADCLPDVRAQNDAALRVEVAVTVFAVAGIVLSLCGKSKYDYGALPSYDIQ